MAKIQKLYLLFKAAQLADDHFWSGIWMGGFKESKSMV